MTEAARRARVMKMVAAAVLLPGVGMMLLMGYFIARSELAHDEVDCPFVSGGERSIEGGLSIREDARRCQDGIEERRWVLLRPGEPERELGRRRLHRELFEDEGYGWTTTIEGDAVVVTVRNPGVPDGELREIAPDD